MCCIVDGRCEKKSFFFTIKKRAKALSSMKLHYVDIYCEEAIRSNFTTVQIDFHGYKVESD